MTNNPLEWVEKPTGIFTAPSLGFEFEVCKRPHEEKVDISLQCFGDDNVINSPWGHTIEEAKSTCQELHQAILKACEDARKESAAVAKQLAIAISSIITTNIEQEKTKEDALSIYREFATRTKAQQPLF